MELDVAPPSAPALAPTGPVVLESSALATADLFTIGRAAVAARRTRVADRGVFVRSRQLLASGAWRGPRDAAEAFVEASDLPTLGGLERAVAEGARLVVLATPDEALGRAALAAGLRVRVRVPFRAGEPAAERAARLASVARLVASGLAIDGVVPTPECEPQGLDALGVFAAARLELAAAGVDHVVADFARLGHRLAQMALGFGADELMGPIVSERALRLGDNANNPAMTRKEAALLLRGAGLVPHERLSGGALEEVVA
jgi:hypothetical protein